MPTQQQNRKRRSSVPAWVSAGLSLAAAVLLLIGLLRYGDGVLYVKAGIDPENDLPINVRAAGDFTRDANGHISYPGAALGVDVSSHQGEIDWQRVRASGVEYAIVRAGYRGYGGGTLVEDERFRENLEGAANAGCRLVVYFFSQALSEQEAVEEAEYVVSLLSGRALALPVFFDWEEVSDEGSRTAGRGDYDVGTYAAAFCKRIEELGYRGGVYFNQRYGYTIMQLEQLKPYVFWLAEYRDAPSFLYDFAVWQYTGEGRVDGIDTVVDLDLLFPA